MWEFLELSKHWYQERGRLDLGLGCKSVVNACIAMRIWMDLVHARR